MTPRYPHVRVQLTGRDGNAFVVIGAVRQALQRADVAPVEVSAFVDEATAGDYSTVLGTAMRWVDVS